MEGLSLQGDWWSETWVGLTQICRVPLADWLLQHLSTAQTRWWNHACSIPPFVYQKWPSSTDTNNTDALVVLKYFKTPECLYYVCLCLLTRIGKPAGPRARASTAPWVEQHKSKSTQPRSQTTRVALYFAQVP